MGNRQQRYQTAADLYQYAMEIERIVRLLDWIDETSSDHRHMAINLVETFDPPPGKQAGDARVPDPETTGWVTIWPRNGETS